MVVSVDSASVWRPRGGDVKFTIQGSGFSAATAQVVTCFRWKDPGDCRDSRTCNQVQGKGQPWTENPYPRLIDDSQSESATYVATVPTRLRGLSSRLLHHLGNLGSDGYSMALGLVPLADFRVIARPVGSATWTAMDVTQPIGITSRTFAMLVTVGVVTLAWLILYRFGKIREVPGAGHPILQIISTKNGYASLSQLQILLWAFVIAGSAIYVIGLSGNLIPISQGTLVLLGISGVATLGAQLQNTTVGQAAPQTSVKAPGNLVLQVTEAGDSDVRLYWAPPEQGSVDSYTVNYRPAAAGPTATWTTATSSLGRPGFRVVGLVPGTVYDFQVFGVNSAGPGPTTEVRASTAPAPTGIGPVKDFGPVSATNRAMDLAWQGVAGAGSYKLQYRMRDSDDPWSERVTPKTSAALTGLEADKVYDLRIAAAAPAAAGAPQFGPWTTISIPTLGPRVPRWSDLVIASDKQEEIDITRVQMLFFTVIVAMFVVLRVLTSSEIPEIPPGFLVLLGISNGVYLTSKFIPR